jgi:hypothetical protein
VIEGAHGLSTSISQKVRVLDRAQSRLRKAMERVDLIIDLKVFVMVSVSAVFSRLLRQNTVATVKNAVKEGQYETASSNISRMLAPYRKRQRTRSMSLRSAKSPLSAGGDIERKISHIFADDFDDEDEEDQASYRVLLKLEEEVVAIFQMRCIV